MSLDAHRQRIVNWINATGGTSSAFDVTTKVLAVVSICSYYFCIEYNGHFNTSWCLSLLSCHWWQLHQLYLGLFASQGLYSDATLIGSVVKGCRKLHNILCWILKSTSGHLILDDNILNKNIVELFYAPSIFLFLSLLLHLHCLSFSR